MKENFPLALAAVLKHEGGYVNHPKDPGGETNKGVTKAVYNAYRKRVDLPRQSVKMISDAEVAAIYRQEYWDRVRGDDLPHGIDYCVFDFAVNSGVFRASKFLQAAVGAARDGKIGPKTVELAGLADANRVVNAICYARLEFLKALPTWRTFGNGWASRVSGVRSMAAKMAAFPPREPLQAVPAPKPPVQPETPQPASTLAAATPRPWWKAWLGLQ